jgi:hypothetical protein
MNAWSTQTRVSAAELAGELEVTANRLTRWLRKQHGAGLPLLVARKPGAPWVFTRADADQLAEAFLSSAGRVSDSEVQRRAEGVIRERWAERLGVPLEPRVVKLAAGAPVHVDAVSPTGAVMAEIFARQGELKGGQQKKVAIDTLKLITIREERPDTKLVIAFADAEASAYATGGGWVAQALRTWKVGVEVVNIEHDLRDEILAAQKQQRMVNADEAAGDVVANA